MTLVATQVKRRRGTTAENDAFTGAEGEITVDIQKHELRVHDGQTQGGHGVLSKEGGTTTGAIIGTSSAQETSEGAVSVQNLSFALDESIPVGKGAGSFRVYDKNGQTFATFGTERYENGTNVVKMQIFNKVNGELQNAVIRLNLGATGVSSISTTGNIWSQLAHSSMPDYSSGVALSNISSYQQIQDDGYILIYGQGSGSWKDIGVSISVNGTTQTYLVNVPNFYGTYVMIAVPKGVYVKAYGSTSQITFMPCRKGV